MGGGENTWQWARARCGTPSFFHENITGWKMRQGFHSNALAGNLGLRKKKTFFIDGASGKWKRWALKMLFCNLGTNKIISYSTARKNFVKRQKISMWIKYSELKFQVKMWNNSLLKMKSPQKFNFNAKIFGLNFFFRVLTVHHLIIDFLIGD